MRLPPARAAVDAASSAAVLEAVRAGGRDFDRLVWTRNRRVMVSTGDGGRTLRLHHCFRDAPPEVLRAVGAFCGGGARARAREVLHAHLAAHPPPAPTPRRRRVLPADEPHLERLRAEFERVNREHFGGELPAAPLFLSGRMRRRNGHFCTDPLEIVISRRLCTDAEPGEAEATLRHEMIHLWQHAQGLRPDHGAAFRRWAGRLGIRPRATREVGWNRTAAGRG